MLCKIVLPSNEMFKLSSFPKTFEELIDAVKSRLKSDFLQNITLKYMDCDNELINLNNAEDFKTAVLINEAEQVKTLKVFVLPQANLNQTFSLINESSRDIQGKKQKSASKIDTPQGKCGNCIKLSSSPRQAFKGIKNFSRVLSDLMDEESNLMSFQNEIGSIDNLIGNKIKEAVQENIKELIPELFTLLQKQQANGKDDTTNSDSAFQANCSLSPPIVANNLYINKKGRSSEAKSDTNTCVECAQKINGIKYVCLECSNYNCCDECENKGGHPHPLLKLRRSINNNSAIQPTLKYSLYISPEKAIKSCGRISAYGLPVNRSFCEKKVSYCGRISSDSMEDQLIKIQPFQQYSVTINVKNIGTESWSNDIKLCCVNGVYRNKEEKLLPLGPGAKQTLILSLEAPSEPGKYLSQWRLCYSDGEKTKSFGESLFLEIQVGDKKAREIQGNKKHSRSQEDIDYMRSDKQLKRFRTFNFVPLTREDGELRIERNSNKTHKIAMYLNEIFPGNLQEKLDFLQNSINNQNEDVCNIVELYLLHITKVKTGRMCKNRRSYSKQPSGEELSVILP